MALSLIGCGSSQVLLVVPFEKTKARAHFFEDGKEIYSVVGNIGRNGVAAINEKREGDGKTPLGKYEITALFGYFDQNASMPYIKANENLICVDDPNSAHYDQIIDKRAAQGEFKSFEEMKREDSQYSYGALISYNKHKEPGKGSCIFIHIEKEPNSPTAGCLSLKEEDVKRLFFGEHRLKIEKRPVIIIKESGEARE